MLSGWVLVARPAAAACREAALTEGMVSRRDMDVEACREDGALRDATQRSGQVVQWLVRAIPSLIVSREPRARIRATQ